MKKLILAAAACAAVLAVGCNKEQQITVVQGSSTFTATLAPLSKTTIDGVKVSWAAGDAINVNGCGSYGIEAAGSEATFVLSAEVSAPYDAVYPAGNYYNPGVINLSNFMFLEQTLMIPLAAHAESGTALNFSPVTAVFKVPVTGADGMQLKTVTFRSKGGEQISGNFTIDYSAPALTGGLDAESQSIEIACEKAPLSATPVIIYIPVPAGSYSGFEITVETVDGTTVTKGTSARTLAVGELRSMPVIDIQAAAAPGGIQTAADLLAFAEAVNSEASLDAWKNADGEIALLADIDLGDCDSWTPIGNPSKTGNGNNACAIEGPRFSGVFNGGGHTIKNFKAASGAIADGCTWGFFGALLCATVKDLSIECSGITLNAASTADAGILAGTVYSSTISNVSVSGSVVISGNNTDNKRFAIGGIAGFVFSDDEDGESLIKDCTVNLEVSGGSGANTKNGATSVQFGGIAGFATAIKTATAVNRIDNCSARGTIAVDCGRCSGILATANCNTIVNGCTNYASQTNGFTDGRIGNIVSMLNLNCGLVGCVNRGDLTTTHAKTTTGGMVALCNDDSCYIEGGGNYGTIKSANADATRHSGLIAGNFSKFKHVKEVNVSGMLGVYDGEFFAVDASNFMDYIGPFSAANAAKIQNLVYVAAQ